MGRLRLNLMVILTMLAITVHAQKYGSTPEDSAACVINMSLYGEFYKQQNLKDAVNPWRKVFLNCPQASENTFIRGTNIVKYIYNQQQDADSRSKVVDTLMTVYDERIQFFSKEGYIRGRQGCDLYSIAPDRFEQANAYLNKSIELESNRSKADVLYFYLQTSIDLLKAEKITSEELVERFDRVMGIIDMNLKQQSGDNLAGYQEAQANCEAIAEPYISCSDLINIYRPKFNANRNDLDLLKKITGSLSKKDDKACTGNPLFFEATKELHKQQPTASSAFLMGRMNIELNKYNDAIPYLKEAAELFESNMDKSLAYLYIGQCYRELGQYPSARTNFFKVTELDPTNGKAYLAIGDMYISSAGDCKDRELKPAYWAAYDKFLKAKAVDTSISELATQQLNRAAVQFPDNQSIFFHNLEVGAPYTVGCWINENTTVRER